MRVSSFCLISSNLLVGVLLSCATRTVQPPDKPNIVLILADDMGYSDIGCFGAEIQTPHLDRLAAEGVRLSSFYNNARCCPSRAALLTGRYPHQVGVGAMTDIGVSIPEYQGYFNEQTVTLADVLQRAGYATYPSGKWHVGEEPAHWPLAHGFDHCFSLIQGAASYFDCLSRPSRGNEPTIRAVGRKESGASLGSHRTGRTLFVLIQ